MENAARWLKIKGKKTKQNYTDLKTRRENQGRPEPYSGRTQSPPGMGPWEGERKQVREDHPPIVHPPPVQKPGLEEHGPKKQWQEQPQAGPPATGPSVQPRLPDQFSDGHCPLIPRSNRWARC